MLPPELLAIWQPCERMGPNERRVTEEFCRLSPGTAKAELAHWLIARLGAVLADAKQPVDLDQLENPS